MDSVNIVMFLDRLIPPGKECDVNTFYLPTKEISNPWIEVRFRLNIWEVRNLPEGYTGIRRTDGDWGWIA